MVLTGIDSMAGWRDSKMTMVLEGGLDVGDDSGPANEVAGLTLRMWDKLRLTCASMACQSPLSGLNPSQTILHH